METTDDKTQFWLDHIQTALSSGQTLKTYAQQHQLDLKRLYNWKSRLTNNGLLPKPSPKGFSRVTLAVPTSEQQTSVSVVATLPNGVRLQIANLSEHTLKVLHSL